MSSDGERDMARKPIRRALISVYDKTGLIDLAQGLNAAGVDIVSTGSTAKAIADQGIAVTPVEELTGFPRYLTAESRHCTLGFMPDCWPTCVNLNTPRRLNNSELRHSN